MTKLATGLATCFGLGKSAAMAVRFSIAKLKANANNKIVATAGPYTLTGSGKLRMGTLIKAPAKSPLIIPIKPVTS
jgi:N-acetylmuramic acid 6-phosphate (MurNAc-6-P) etherase